LLAGILVGGGVALLLRGGSAQNDPCFGHGDLIATRTYTVSSDGAANAREIGVSAKTGERREARQCRAGPLETFVVDGATGLVLSSETSIADAVAHFEQYPEEAPVARAQRAAKEAFAAVDRSSVGALLNSTACGAAWRRLDIPRRDLRLCSPNSWKVDASAAARVLLTTPKVTLNVHSPAAPASLECDQAQTFETPRGPVSACAMSPLEGGQSHHLLLPDGIIVFLWVSDTATPTERSTAFRVAMSVEALP
jgi:hypothetical protein